MNDQFPNNERDREIAQKLSHVAEQTHANAQFTTELEERLRQGRQSKTGWLAASFKQVSPVLRWGALLTLLALALSWSIKTLIPAPQPAADNTLVAAETITPTPAIISQTATPSPQEGGYDFRGAKLYLAALLPDSPAQAHVYLLNKDEPATQEQALALAERFGVHGEVYTAPSLISGTTDYVISDGKQFLQVYSERYFVYTSNIAKNNRNPNGIPNPNAETIIREFLQGRGLDFSFRVSADEARGGYVAQPLAPDSIPMQYESFAQPVMRVTLDENGEVLSMNASLLAYDPTPTGEYGIITAQEALQRLLDDNRPEGKIEFFHSPSKSFQDWYRDYPDNLPVTIYGNVTANPAVEAGTPALLLIDGTPAVGNTAGMENLDYYTFVRATGQYVLEEGIRKFHVESWDTNVQLAYLMGTLHREGDQIVLISDDGSGKRYPLVDPPADVPLDTEMSISQLSVDGVIVDGRLDWRFIRYIPDVNESGGGGGGGGSGFFQLNLSGTPVPFPIPTAQSGITVPGKDSVYTIQEGDTVLAIAEAFGVTPEKIIEANPWLREVHVLIPGKTLIIPAAESDLAPNEYIVQENDTLASIALNHGISVEELMKANGITNDMVFLGQRLLIPNAGSSSYTVQEGDTLNMIAQSLGITVDELMRINGMSDPVIYVGQLLIVPTTDSVEQNIEDLRGFLSIALHKRIDGTESKEYSLIVNRDGSPEFYLLEGTNLSELDAYHALPILISGTARTNQVMSTIQVEAYEIPFPDLHFQIVKGTQHSEQIEGQTAVIFTTEDGKSYVEFMGSTDILNDQFIGLQGDLIQQEVLIIPDESFGGMPVIRVYQSSVIEEGAPEMQVQANQILVIDDTTIPGLPVDYVPPNLTLEVVELMYFVSNPYYQVNDPNYSQRSPYIQPVWHFHGRYDDGSEFDVLIQALKQEFLLPELAPGVSPG
jgi:LysM repeat protein